jgi:hypothetical protein
MRSRKLRHVVQALVVLGLPVSHGGCILDDCYTLHRRSYSIPLPTDPSVQFQIDRCELDVEACPDLCTLMLARDGEGGEITGCDLSVGDTRARVVVFTKDFTGGGSCAVNDGDDALHPIPPPR